MFKVTIKNRNYECVADYQHQVEEFICDLAGIEKFDMDKDCHTRGGLKNGWFLRGTVKSLNHNEDLEIQIDYTRERD